MSQLTLDDLGAPPTESPGGDEPEGSLEDEPVNPMEADAMVAAFFDNGLLLSLIHI